MMLRGPATEPRTLLIVVASMFLITLLGAYGLLFKPELAELVQLEAEKRELIRDVQGGEGPTGETRMRHLQAEIDRLQGVLQGLAGPMTPSHLVAHVIGQLDAVSARHSVQLVSVQPGARSRVQWFEEMTFAIEVQGAYGDLYAWLQDAERQLRPMVVRQFQIAPRDREGGGVTLALRMVSYRSLEDGA
ncbi:MAG: hypothetical protein ACFCVA_05805 [Gammaproteobacteria bacterium]